MHVGLPEFDFYIRNRLSFLIQHPTHEVDDGLRSLDDLDHRTLAAKRTRQLLGDIVSDLGGPENVTAAQRQLVQRAAILGDYLEDIEFKWASGIPVTEYLVAVNAQRRVLATIGLKAPPGRPGGAF